MLTPVRSAAGWVSDTLHAKSQVKQLQAQVANLTVRLAQAKGAQIQNQQLKAQLHLDASLDISSYHPVTAQVILRDPTLWYQTIGIDKGAVDGRGAARSGAGRRRAGRRGHRGLGQRVVRVADHRSHGVGDRAGDRCQRGHGRAGPGGRQPQPAGPPVPPAPEPEPDPERPPAGPVGGHGRLQVRARSSRTSRPTSRSGGWPRSTRTSCSTTARSRSRRPPTCGASTWSRS